MRAAIYTRVSEDRDAGARSVTEQEAECRAFCERQGWSVAAVFPDNDRSASRYATKTRPRFEQLQRFIEHGDCDVLVTWEASRSGRDLAVYVALRDLCRARGVLWSYSGRTFDLSNESDQFSTGLDALLAERESAMTSTRVRRSMRANATVGRPHGRHLYGYRRVYDSTTKRLLSVEFAEDEAAVLREAAERILAGESLAGIADDFNERGITTATGSQWRSSHISRAVTNPAYAGERVHQGQVIGAAIWPPLFDETTWWRLQAVLSDPARHTARDHHVVKYLLGGVARCGRAGCDAAVYVLNNRGTPSYVCSAGAHVSRRREPVDQLVEDVLVAGLAKQGHRDAFTADPTTGGRMSPWAGVEAKRARLDAFYDSAAKGEITAAALARIEQKLLAEITRDEAAARRATVPPVIQALGDVDVAEVWDTLPVKTKRAVIRHYLDIRILPTGRGRRGFDPASVQINWKV